MEMSLLLLLMLMLMLMVRGIRWVMTIIEGEGGKGVEATRSR
jgi:hypothetical protein